MTKRDSSKSSQSSRQHLNVGNIKTMASRFRFARSLVPLTRTAFCNKHGLNYSTLQSWEISRSNSREGNVAKFCEALSQEGVFCTEDWLFEGKGPPPARSSTEGMTCYSPLLTARGLKHRSSELNTGLAQEEVLFFQENCKEKRVDAVTIQILDDAMHPEYEKGEYVGALRVPLGQAHQLNQTICLIETIPHHFLARQLLIEGDKFILLTSNKAFPVLSFDALTSIAQIVWRRKIPIHLLEI